MRDLPTDKSNRYFINRNINRLARPSLLAESLGAKSVVSTPAIEPEPTTRAFAGLTTPSRSASARVDSLQKKTLVAAAHESRSISQRRALFGPLAEKSAIP